MNTTFAERLAAARKASGMSQQELAAKARSNHSLISMYENGKSNPSLEKFTAICRALETSADELLGIQPQEKQPDPSERKPFGRPRLGGERQVCRPVEREMSNHLLTWRQAATNVRDRIRDKEVLKLAIAADSTLDDLLRCLMSEVLRLGSVKPKGADEGR